MSYRRFLCRRYWDVERSREIASYLEIEIADNIARGMPPSDAACAARRKFGNPTLIREEIYRMNTLSWWESVTQDLRYGVRLLVANPGFAVVAIASLALGIGANTAIFQLMDAVRLRTLPVANPRELAEIKIVDGNGGMGLNGPYGELTPALWQEISLDHPAFSNVFAWSKAKLSVGEGSHFRAVNGMLVSGEFFQVLGLAPWRGRLLLPEDEHACPGSTAVVSHSYWQNQMGGAPIDARTRLLISGEMMQVVGVAPPEFPGLAVGEQFEVALPYCRQKEVSRNTFELSVMGRLRPGWTIERASSQLAGQSPGIMAATEITGYEAGTVKKYRRFRLGAYSAASGVSELRKAYETSLTLLLVITALVLLIACANLANLMLARAGARGREIALRLALGAGRARLFQQLLAESALLTVIGTVLGIVLARVLSRALVMALSTADDSVSLHLDTNWHVLLFAAAAASLTCVIFGMVPAFRASSADPIVAIKTGGRGVTQNRERFSLQRVMVVTQIAVSLVLLVGALLFVRSFNNLITFDPGMREQGITLAFVGFQRTSLPRERYDEFRRTLLDDVRLLPGVLHAATTTHVPLIGGSWGHGITIRSQEGSSMFTWASPGYFETMGTRLVSGRDFRQGDTGTSQRVAIVNQTFVRRYLNGTNPIGQILRTHPEPNYPATLYEIVGVVSDTQYDGLRGETPPETFAPASQFPDQRPWTAMMIHSDLPSATVAASLKRAVAEKHPELIVQCQDFEARIRDGLVRERLMALLSGFFGLLASLLAMVGLYGVISYVVTRRRNEIGIRVALGANRGDVAGLVMREAGILLALGVAIGGALSLAAGRSAGSLLFGLKSYDPLTLGSAIGMLVSIGVAAALLPARRASKLDPMVALRDN